MANLFLYTGTTFLRQDGQARAGTAGEAQFAYTNMLFQGHNVVWQTLHNVDPETSGTREGGSRRFRYLRGHAPNMLGTRLHTVLTTASIRKNARMIDVEDGPRVGEKVYFTSDEIGKARTDPTEVDILEVGNSSGRVPLKQANNLVNDVIQVADLTTPLFSVGDCNSFHNSAYFLGSLALHGKAGPVLIVNVDQHMDIGTVGGERDVVSSDGWAKQLLNRVNTGAYLCLGCGGTTEMAGQNVCLYKAAGAAVTGWPTFRAALNGAKINKAELVADNTANLQAHLQTILTYLQTQLGQDFASIYITVDRDCMKKNYTQWGELGAVIATPAIVRRILTTVMEAMGVVAPAAALVGMDITGLPEEGEGPGDGSFRYQDVKDELRAYHDFLHDWQ